MLHARFSVTIMFYHRARGRFVQHAVRGGMRGKEKDGEAAMMARSHDGV
jgi:hypothetical protein